MLVIEKTHRIKVSLTGSGSKKIAALIREHFPEASITDEKDELVRWDDTDLAHEIRAAKTPGKLLRAYRGRAGLTVVQLATNVGTKYPNITAMENDRRPVGLEMAKKLGKALDVDFHKFID
jgi:antitoxin component HigA of HigAB toxin-antitoxin module